MSTFVLKPASKKALRLRIGITGPSGSGKTFSALLLASGIAAWDKIAVIDTENRSAEYYADLGPWNHIDFEPPYTVERYIQAILAAEAAGMEVIVLDSTSAAWAGTGGLLEVMDKMPGQTFNKYATITPVYERLLNTIRLSRCHVVCCFRSKMDTAMQTNAQGKAEVKQMGLQPIFRPGWEYEFGIIFDVNADHDATVSKDRTSQFAGQLPFRIEASCGKALLGWAESGVVEPEAFDKERANGYTLLLSDISESLPPKEAAAFQARFNEAWKAKSMEGLRAVIAEAEDRAAQLGAQPPPAE